jgi:hypothetical protein
MVQLPSKFRCVVTFQDEMLGSVDGDWKLLILDASTTRIMSHACRISDILNFNIACKP